MIYVIENILFQISFSDLDLKATMPLRHEPSIWQKKKKKKTKIIATGAY